MTSTARQIEYAQKLQARLAEDYNLVPFNRDIALENATSSLRRSMLGAVEAVEKLDAGKKLGPTYLSMLGCESADEVRGLAALKGRPDALRERAIAEVDAYQTRRAELITMDMTTLSRDEISKVIDEMK